MTRPLCFGIRRRTWQLSRDDGAGRRAADRALSRPAAPPAPAALGQFTGSAPSAWRSRNQHWHVLQVLLVGGLVAPPLDAAAFEGGQAGDLGK